MQIVFLSTMPTTTTTVALDAIANVYVWLHYEMKRFSTTNFVDREFGWALGARCVHENRRNEMEAISFSLCFYSSQWLRIRNKNMPLSAFSSDEFTEKMLNRFYFGFCFRVLLLSRSAWVWTDEARAERGIGWPMKPHSHTCYCNMLATRVPIMTLRYALTKCYSFHSTP